MSKVSDYEDLFSPNLTKVVKNLSQNYKKRLKLLKKTQNT